MREISRLTTLASAPAASQTQGADLFKGFSSLSKGVRNILRDSCAILTTHLPKLTDRLKEGGFDNLLSGVKNFLPTNNLLPVTRVVEAILDPTIASTASLQTTDDYLFLDPKLPRATNTKPKRMTFGEGIVFIVGGGGYVEYTNITEWAAKAGTTSASPGLQGKKVSYGSTEILDPTEFLDVLSHLAN